MTIHNSDDAPKIRPGGIVHDLGQPGWPAMWVVRKEAESVETYRQERGTDLLDFDKNLIAGASDDDEVYLVQYLVDGPLSEPNTRYPVPSSRLAPQDLMAASHIADDHAPVRHPIDQALEDFLTDVLAEMKGTAPSDPPVVEHLLAAADGVIDQDVLDVADERSDARVGRPATTDGGQGVHDGADGSYHDEEDDGLGDFDPTGGA